MNCALRFEVLRDTAQPGFSHLRGASESEGFGFLARMHREWQDATLDFSRAGELALIGFRDTVPVAVGARSIDPYVTDAGSDRPIGRLRHMYVHPDARDEGLGAVLLAEVLQDWQARFAMMRLRAASADAGRFYARHGFTPVSDVPECTHVLYPAGPATLPRSTRPKRTSGG